MRPVVPVLVSWVTSVLGHLHLLVANQRRPTLNRVMTCCTCTTTTMNLVMQQVRDHDLSLLMYDWVLKQQKSDAISH
ncbi:hypothetical protein F4821DRAFT_240978 [Hypoxylon rubiginosum]|uniref:Uncharacterized protein n=1 Tax=Hypoxylon rubiginosum TaxID=110542 RepID=A0ACC0CYK9_9PEZI|nr:hypothetical protein F4821DRAFT_240978 [Hypoxylon rubiginosum]